MTDSRAVGEHLAEYVTRAPKSWWPGDSRTYHGRAMARRWELGSAGAVCNDDTWRDESFQALRRWHAFRGAAETIDAPRYQSVIDRLVPTLGSLERVGICATESPITVCYSPAGHDEALLELFRTAATVKSDGSPRMVASKVLCQLLPDLVVPMDNKFTAPFFGRRSLRFPLSESFLETTYEAFATIAAVGAPVMGDLAASFGPRLGLARVIDFGIAGSQL